MRQVAPESLTFMSDLNVLCKLAIIETITHCIPVKDALRIHSQSKV